MNFKRFLRKLDACEAALEWVKDRTVEETINDCHRGDWIVWLAVKVGVDILDITKAQVECFKLIQCHLDDDDKKLLAVAKRYVKGGSRKAMYKAHNRAREMRLDGWGHGECIASALEKTLSFDDNANYQSNAIDYMQDIADYYSDTPYDENFQTKAADICRKLLGNQIIIKVLERTAYIS